MAAVPSHLVVLHLPDGSCKELPVREDQHIWDAAHAAGIELPSICHQGRCLTCAGRLLTPGDWDSSDSVACFPEDRAARFILLCTGVSAFRLEMKTHQPTRYAPAPPPVGPPGVLTQA